MHLQRSHGNQAVQRLVRSGAIQPKRRGNGPGDRYEQEADRADEQVTRVSEPVVQRTCACGNHTTVGDECAECSEKQRSRLQTKLRVNELGDIYEQEADRITDQVMAMPANSGVSGVLPRIQRFAGQSNGQMDAAPSSVDQALASPGRPLEPALRQDMEQRFGYDFSRVRVHSGGAAEQSARDVAALAYTVGQDMVFGAGQFEPDTNEGRRLIAHELTHVVQSRPASKPKVIRRAPGDGQGQAGVGPTYGNMPRDPAAIGSSRDVVRLKEVRGTWMEIGPRYTKTARGRYFFVVQNGEIFAVKAKRTRGGWGHTEAARGGRVSWAGGIDFEAGKVLAWDDGSGHYRPVSGKAPSKEAPSNIWRQPAVQAGLPEDKFKKHPDPPKGKQLPSWQPETKSRTPGQQPKVGPGPPREEEFERRYRKSSATRPATSTGVPSATTAGLLEEAGSVLKVEGRTTASIGKIGTAAGWVADFLMPGPLDALGLMVEFAMTYAGTQEAARSEGLRSGFRQGLCAGLLRLSRRWVRDNLAPRVVTRTTASHVAATTGYREKGLVQGLAAGLSFAERLSAEQRRALLHEAVRAMRAKGKDVRLRDWWKRGYTYDDIKDLSVALAPRVDELLKQARKNEELRQAAAEWKKIEKSLEKSLHIH